MGPTSPAARGLGRRRGPPPLPLLLPLLLLLLRAQLAVGSLAGGSPGAAEAPGSAQVAGLCGHLTLHRDLRTGRWEPDPQRSRRCLRDPQRVLEYCRQMYPELQIARVEQATQAIPMERWCGGARGGRCAHPHHQVVPFRCLPGEFVSEALLVPEGCRFLHQERMDQCESSTRRHQEAQEACSSQGLILHGSGMLLPCGTDRFRGVEYVCCPPPVTPDPSGTAVGDPSTRSWPLGGRVEGGEDEEEEESFLQPVDDYFVEPPRAEEEEEEERILPSSSHSPAAVSKVTTTPRPTDGVDVYFGMPGEISEHEGFLRAKMDLEERRMRQINEVMREWAMADNQSKNLPKADRQALNEHFQSILQTLEEQVSGERQRLVETHATRVIALINDQRRAALEGFLAALQGDPPQAERVLLALRRYLRAEQKEQRHTLRHFQHVAAVDPEKAQQMRFQVQTHLQVIEERMNQSLGLLDQNPRLAQELRPQIQELLHSEHLGPNELEAPAPGGSSEDKGGLQPLDSKDADTPMALPKGSTEQDAASPGKEKMSPLEQYERKVNVSVPRGFPFHSSEIQRDELAPAGTGVSREAVSGLLIMGAGGGSLIVLSLLLLRRKKPYGAISHGVVEVDPMLTLEEQQLRELQRHGYENPTYRFLEERP
ncbi:amyloid beta precursor like protein 1 isoform X1 [Ursus americanus]|uniref:amyloid beta precursor like protein 1 isoform X1 n=1 Tax=Ursus americanus TaxID=9643 RepID=UPI000E6E096A|nr:amyloid beta precursor like protein 1 isoform X1 [Ursus americanus]XP_048079813.1 amyloid beta precursor like protein 1 isoform X1 [Ursus arctos]